MRKLPKYAALLLAAAMTLTLASTVLAEPAAEEQPARDLLYLTNDPEGKGGMVTNMPAKELKVAYGATVTLNGTTIPQREGYAFLGWGLVGGKSNASSQVASVVAGQADLKIDAYGRYVVYAIWGKAARDLLYLGNDPEGAADKIANLPAAETSVGYGAAVALNGAAIPQREGYSFLGWSLTGGNDNAANVVTGVVAGQAGLSIDAEGRYVVYAAWEKDADPTAPPSEEPAGPSPTQEPSGSPGGAILATGDDGAEGDIPLGMPATGCAEVLFLAAGLVALAVALAAVGRRLARGAK
ncbi:MAG TPA: InlB B-repeat-containing protein [Clostridia bacterium]|nr:InlB B-repeat-containing protein [Clostridia bacterium]